MEFCDLAIISLVFFKKFVARKIESMLVILIAGLLCMPFVLAALPRVKYAMLVFPLILISQ